MYETVGILGEYWEQSWGGGPPGDLGRASLQGGSQEFGGERGERFRNSLGTNFDYFLRF